MGKVASWCKCNPHVGCVLKKKTLGLGSVFKSSIIGLASKNRRLFLLIAELYFAIYKQCKSESEYYFGIAFYFLLKDL